MVGHERVADGHGVAAEAKGVGGADFHAVGLGGAGVDGLERAAVEGGWVIHKPAVGQGSEAGVEMIKALVYKAERDDFAPENFRPDSKMFSFGRRVPKNINSRLDHWR